MIGRREAILRELRIGPLWRLRDAPDRGEVPTDTARPDSVASPVAAAPVAVRVPERPAAVPPAASPVPLPVAESAKPSVGDLGWSELEAQIRDCTACVLHRQRKQAVPGVGDRNPDWLMVGEGPGAEEDRRGEPFVGPAGMLLDAMLAAVGISRRAGAYIANSVKCRPPNNRTPETAEIATCFPYLERQVALLRPRLIVALGRPAAQSLLNREIRIADARGQTYAFAGIPVVVTYHPAYLLRNPHDKAKAWEDLCRARRLAPPGSR